MAKNLSLILLAMFALPGSALADFTGPFAAAAWSITDPGPLAVPGEVDTIGTASFDPGATTLTIVSPDCAEGGSGCTGPAYTFAITTLVGADAFLSFDWSFATSDGADFDKLGVWLDGTFNQLIDQSLGTTPQAGSAGINVLTGQTVGFGLLSSDSVAGPSTSTITSFTVAPFGTGPDGPFAVPVPLPATAWLLGSVVGLLGLRRRKAI